MQLLQEDYATLARRLSNRCARLLTQRRQNKRFASVGSGYPFLGRSVIVSLAELNLTSSYISTVPNRSRLRPPERPPSKSNGRSGSVLPTVFRSYQRQGQIVRVGPS